jgi:mediator of RNA polymerase II transcription subunit 13
MNFDSCVLCACTPNELSIRGIDSTIYLEKPRDFLKLPSTPTPAGGNQNQNIHSPYHPHMYPHQQSSYHHHPHPALYAQQQQQHHQQIIPSNNNNNNNNNNSCSCGFSAVVNLRLSYLSGLFYEDEIEITGIKADLKYRQSNDQLPVQLLELIERKECLPSPFDYFINKTFNNKKTDQDVSQTLKQPAYQYENWACRAAIEQSRNPVNGLITDDLDKHHWLHQWSYSTSPLDSDQQLITMLRSLQPLLVEALKKRTVNGLWSTIDGPLTWKSFHQLLYVQNQHVQLEEQISGPQPIPYILAGLDREWVMLAPYSLKFWDKLCLEPYSKGKDVAYICVVPDNDYICSTTKTYFRELSTHYELCRLGIHRPLLKAFSDQGLLRINPFNNDLTSSLPNVDQWFTDHENSHPLGTKLKQYAQILKGQLLNLLSNQSFDNSLLEEGTSRRDVFRTPNDLSNPSSSSSLDLHSSSNDLTNNIYALSPSSTTTNSSLIANNIYTTGSATSDALSLSSSNPASLTNGTLVNGHQVDPVDLQAFESFHQGRVSNDEQFFIVIYLIDTFRYEITASKTEENGSNMDIDDRMDAYVKKAIFRAYMDLLKDLPDKISIRVNVQIIPFESIINQQVESDSELRLTQLKRLAFHVYGQLKRTVSYTTRAKSLTGFGPAASEEKMPAKIVMQLYTPAYILSPKSDFRFKAFADITEQTNINGSILFCSYCLSDDQRYLLASCSDDRGELLETCSINIEVPDR